MIAVLVLITGRKSFGLELARDGETLRQACERERELPGQGSGLEKLAKMHRQISWANVYIQQPDEQDTAVCDVDTPLHHGAVVALTCRIQGSGGGKGAFQREMVRRVKNDLADPFTSDEAREKLQSRADESVWGEFWDQSGGNPPCSYPLSAVPHKEKAQ